ncbi:MAG: VanZ family protein, partial [Macromonas bipunctata]|nr:VanZ family protein [Macromonas bipunctata]
MMPLRVTGLARVAFWACLLGVVVLSLTPVQQLPPQVLNLWDKAQHAGGFAVLTLLGLWAYPQRAVTLLAAMLALGVGIEIGRAA